jgi:integrase/recombinase XerD
MHSRTPIGSWLRRFLLEHIVSQRNLSRNTQASYRDTLLLLLPFLAKRARVSVDRLAIQDLTPSSILCFLEHLERDRGCSTATRNQRLGAIRSFAKFVGAHSPEHLEWCTKVRMTPFKKTGAPLMPYLDKDEVDALLETPDQDTQQGRRDYALLLLLYNTGARVGEAAHLAVSDVTLGRSPSVRLLGKGSKTRCCPLWKHTADTIRRLVGSRAECERVFLNRLGQPLTRFGIYGIVQRVARVTKDQRPSLRSKRISPHTLRHSCAVGLLRAGVDINTIRSWLGHVSLDTTNVYAEVDLEMKARALAHCDVPNAREGKRWHGDPSLVAFLKTLGHPPM